MTNAYATTLGLKQSHFRQALASGAAEGFGAADLLSAYTGRRLGDHLIKSGKLNVIKPHHEARLPATS